MTEGYADDLVVLSGFSGQPMGDDDGGPRDVVAGQFMAAASGTPEGDFYDTDDDGEFGDARRIDSWIQREWVRPTAVEQ